MKKSACHPDIYIYTKKTKRGVKKDRVQLAVEQPSSDSVLAVRIKDGHHYYVDGNNLQKENRKV